jgi:hypothetical protein
MVALSARKVDIWIIKETGKVVFSEAEAKSLIIDKPSFTTSNQYILALEIAMN